MAVPRALSEAVQKGRLVVFCGAGVSVGAPSYLPNWWTFNELILGGMRHSALQALHELPEGTREVVDRLSLADLPLIAFSEVIVSAFAGPGWSRVLRLLDSDTPNATHGALAQLARLGALEAIVSTNFDTLIERAFRRAGVPLTVFARPEDYEDDQGGTCGLYKIHGSVSDELSLVDTVSQKLRGLGARPRRRIAELARANHVLVIGYSGMDLAFDQDYLGITSVLEDGPGLTWLVRPRDRLGDQATHLVAAAGDRGAIIEGSLPSFLGELGVSVDASVDDDQDAEAAATARAREVIEAWLSEPGYGPLACSACLLRLLSRMGWQREAAVVAEHLAALPEVSGPSVPLEASLAFRALALAVMETHPEQARGWLRREILLTEHLNQLFEEHGGGEDSRLERSNNLASSWLNLAVCAIGTGDVDEGRAALERALPLAEATDNRAVLAAINLKYANLEEDLRGDLEAALARLRPARIHGLAAGSADIVVDIDATAARIAIELGEYDMAASALQRANDYVALNPNFAKESELRLFAAKIDIRRGRATEACASLAELVRSAEGQGNPRLADRLRWQMCLELYFNSETRPAIRLELERVLARRGEHGDDAGLPSEETLRKAHEALSSDEPSTPPFLVARERPADEEVVTRRALRRLEYAQALDEIPKTLEQLWRLYYRRGDPLRLLDLSRAHMAAAARSDLPDARAAAFDLLGIAHDVGGDLHEAIDAYRRGLAATPDYPLRAALEHNLAVTLARVGDFEEAFSRFESAAAAHAVHGEPDEESRALMQLASALLRAGQRARAAEAAAAALAVAERASDPRAARAVRALIERVDVDDASLAREGTRSLGGERDILTSDRRPGLPRDALEKLRRQAHTAEDLGDLSLREWEVGENEAAWATSRLALASYAARQDDIGVSRCLNNQAMFSAAAGDWPEACRLAEEALSLRVRLGDVAGQQLTLAALADYELGRARPQVAAKYATRSLELSAGQPVGDATIKAGLALLWSAEELDDPIQVIEAAKVLLTTLDRADSTEFAELRARLRSILDAADAGPADMRDDAADPFAEMLAEATRLSRLAAVDEVERILDELTQGRELTAQQRGWMEGTRANALQNAGRHDEAVATYEAATDLLESAGDPNAAMTAAIQRTVSLRLSGRLHEAETALRALVDAAPSEDHAAQARTTLANTLLERAQRSDQIDEAATLLDEARALLSAAAEQADDIEGRGIALVSLANVHILADERANAIATLREAVVYLRRSNSRHLDAIEHRLSELEGDQ